MIVAWSSVIRRAHQVLQLSDGVSRLGLLQPCSSSLRQGLCVPDQQGPCSQPQPQQQHQLHTHAASNHSSGVNTWHSRASLVGPQGVLASLHRLPPQGLDPAFTPSGPHCRQVRSFIFLPSPRQLKDEFLDPDRAGTSYLITANVLTALLTTWNRRLFMQLAQNNFLIAQGEWWRLLTAPFLHAGILHLAGNMLALHFLGPPVEYVVGRACLGFIYMSGALCGGLAHYHYGTWHGLGVGSSGAIAGLFSAWVVYKLRNRHMVGFTQGDMQYVVQMVVINALLAFALGGSIGHMAHMGGLVGGAAAMFLVGPRLVWSAGHVVNKPIIPLFFRNTH